MSEELYAELSEIESDLAAMVDRWQALAENSEDDEAASNWRVYAADLEKVLIMVRADLAARAGT